MQASQTLKAWILILPGFILTLLILAYPTYEILRLSLHDVSRFGLLREFVGLGNFIKLIQDPIFIQATLRTLLWTAAVVGGTILISVPVALLLNEDFIGRGLARTIIMLPWSVSLTMTAIVWRWGFNGEYGMVNVALQQLGIISQPIQWLATANFAFPVEVMVGILVSIPFTVTIFLGGLSSVPHDIYEAAQVEGASRWQMFHELTLPLLKPFINMAIILNVIYVFNSFPIIWVMTQGGPNNETHILVTYLYELGFKLGRPGDAAAISLMMLCMLLSFTFLYAYLQNKRER